jgi:hypothetical protein
MRRSKRPPALELSIRVFHPESIDFGKSSKGVPLGEYIERCQAAFRPVDDDGHHLTYGMLKASDYALLSLTLQRGMAPQAAAELLRKVASRIEGQPGLLTLRQGQLGCFLPDGGIEEDFPEIM